MKKKYYIIIAVVVVLLIIAIPKLIGEEGNTWQKVENKQLKETLTVTGNVKALQESNIKAPLTGKILNVYVQEGDIVKKGQIIAEYDKAIFMAQLNAAKSRSYQARQTYNKMLSGNRKQDVSSAKANYEQNKVILEQKKLFYEKLKNDEKRNTVLHSKNMMTPKEFEDYKKDLEIARLAYNSQDYVLKSVLDQYNLTKEGFRKEDIIGAKAALNETDALVEESQTLFDKTEIRSAIDGKVNQKLIFSGDNVLAGDMLFTISSKQDLEVKALIEEEDIYNIRLNDEVLMELDAYPRKEIKGQVVSIYDKVEVSTRLLPVKISITDNPENLELLPGMTASCTFAGHLSDYLTVPKKALQRDGKKFFVETKQGKIYLEVGKEHADKVLVKGKLKPGEEVYVK